MAHKDVFRRSEAPERLLRGVSALTVALLLLAAVTAGAEERERHSGVITSIGRNGTFVLAEVGPWMPGRAIVITKRTINLVDETQYAMTARVWDSMAAFPGGFAEWSVLPDEVYVGDYVTVECRRAGKRLVALKLTVTLVGP